MKRCTSLNNATGIGAIFHYAHLENCDISNANFGSAKFNWSMLNNTDFSASNLTSSNFDGADLENVNFENALLTDADLNNVINWKTISIKGANVKGIKNVPAGFVEWALLNGAVETP